MAVSRLAIPLLFAVGCTGTIDNQLPPGLTPAQAHALELWTQKALPILKMQCFTGCHDGSVPADGFLVGMSDTMIRDTAIGFMPPVVNLSSPATSTMVTKGMHEGPPLTA